MATDQFEVVVVVAAGNDAGEACSHSPGRASSSVHEGSHDPDDGISWLQHWLVRRRSSSWKFEIFAPLAGETIIVFDLGGANGGPARSSLERVFGEAEDHPGPICPGR